MAGSFPLPPFFQQQPPIFFLGIHLTPVQAEAHPPLQGTPNTLRGGASLIPCVTWSHGAALLLSFMWVTHVLCGSPQSLPAKFFVVCVCLK